MLEMGGMLRVGGGGDNAWFVRNISIDNIVIITTSIKPYAMPSGVLKSIMCAHLERNKTLENKINYKSVWKKFWRGDSMPEGVVSICKPWYWNIPASDVIAWSLV